MKITYVVEVTTDKNNIHDGKHCWPRTSLPFPSTAGTLALIIHGDGAFPEHYNSRRSNPDPHRLDGRRTPSPQAMTTRNILKLCPDREALTWELKHIIAGAGRIAGLGFQPSTSGLSVPVGKCRICTVGSHCIYTDPTLQGDLSPQLGRSNKNIWSVIINLMSHGKW